MARFRAIRPRDPAHSGHAAAPITIPANYRGRCQAHYAGRAGGAGGRPMGRDSRRPGQHASNPAIRHRPVKPSLMTKSELEIIRRHIRQKEDALTRQLALVSELTRDGARSRRRLASCRLELTRHAKAGHGWQSTRWHHFVEAPEGRLNVVDVRGLAEA